MRSKTIPKYTSISIGYTVAAMSAKHESLGGVREQPGIGDDSEKGQGLRTMRGFAQYLKSSRPKDRSVVQDNGSSVDPKLPKWSLGVLNDTRTDEVPGRTPTP